MTSGATYLHRYLIRLGDRVEWGTLKGYVKAIDRRVVHHNFDFLVEWESCTVPNRCWSQDEIIGCTGEFEQNNIIWKLRPKILNEKERTQRE